MYVQVRESKKGSVPLLAAKRSVGVKPEVNPRNSFHAGNKAYNNGIHSGQMLQEVQNRGISGTTEIYLRKDSRL